MISPRVLLLWIAVALLVAGIAFGFWPHSVDGIDCGTAFSPDSAAMCESAATDAKPFAFGLVALGALAGITSVSASGDKTLNWSA